MKGVESLRIQSFKGFWKSRKIPGLDFRESRDRDFEKIPGSRDIPGSRWGLLRTWGRYDLIESGLSEAKKMSYVGVA